MKANKRLLLLLLLLILTTFSCVTSKVTRYCRYGVCYAWDLCCSFKLAAPDGKLLRYIPLSFGMPAAALHSTRLKPQPEDFAPAVFHFHWVGGKDSCGKAIGLFSQLPWRVVVYTMKYCKLQVFGWDQHFWERKRNTCLRSTFLRGVLNLKQYSSPSYGSWNIRCVHRRRIELEDKAKVVTSDWGT